MISITTVVSEQGLAFSQLVTKGTFLEIAFVMKNKTRVGRRPCLLPPYIHVQDRAVTTADREVEH